MARRARTYETQQNTKYAIIIRWDTFRLDLVGRTQIIGAAMLLIALIGLKVYFL
jgi:hypothetical protein